MPPKLYFCFPYRGVGGVSMLFLRLAEELASRGLAECHMVDYADGFMAKNRKPELTHFVEYVDDREVWIGQDGLAIFQAMTPWSIFPALRFAAETRFFFWNCHPFNLVPTMPGIRRLMQRNSAIGPMLVATLLRRYRTVMRRFVSALVRRRALVFMDRTNVETTERYLRLPIVAPEMLAIPAPRSPERSHPEPHPRLLRFTWVGRIVDFKYYPLIHALRQIDALQPKLGIRLTVDIIGLGDHEPVLRADVASLRCVEVQFLGELSPPAVELHLAERTDVLLAMGTAALEGARLGVPTVLLDFSYGAVPEDYSYSWLHEGDGFSLGDVARAADGEQGGGSLLARLQELIRQPKVVSAASREYFRRHHGIDMVSDRFLELVNDSRCTYADLAACGVLNRGFTYRTLCAIRGRLGTR